jgi:hypothetical protein
MSHLFPDLVNGAVYHDGGGREDAESGRHNDEVLDATEAGDDYGVVDVVASATCVVASSSRRTGVVVMTNPPVSGVQGQGKRSA